MRTSRLWLRSLLFLTVVVASAPGMPGHAAQMEAGPGKVQPGILSDFEGEEPAAAFGAGWATLDDTVMGGSSSSSIAVVDGGADGSAQSLSVTGELRIGAPSPWAGAVFFSGAAPFANIDLTSLTQISFWARGEGGGYAVVLMTANLGMQPAFIPFAAGDEWTEYSFSLADFEGADTSAVNGFIFVAGGDAAEFAFQIDQVAFR